MAEIKASKSEPDIPFPASLIPTLDEAGSPGDSYLSRTLTLYPGLCDSRVGVVGMGTAVRVTRVDLTAAELRPASAKCAYGAQVRRVLAVAFVLEGRPRTEPATSLAWIVRR